MPGTDLLIGTIRANALRPWKLLLGKEKKWCRGAESNCRHHDVGLLLTGIRNNVCLGRGCAATVCHSRDGELKLTSAARSVQGWLNWHCPEEHEMQIPVRGYYPFVVVCLTLAGCGGGTDSPASTAGGGDGSALGDPCALLTAADFRAASGLPFGEGAFNESFSAPERRICDWTSSDPYATGQVLIAPGAGFASSRQDIEEAFDEKVVSLGVPGADDAYATSEGSIVAILVGDSFIQVSYIPPGPGNVTEITQVLAATAVSNL